MKRTSVILEKKAQLEILESLFERLDDLETNYGYRYEKVGKYDYQAKDWRTGELEWEDEEHTIPHYDDKYGYVEVPDDELTEKDIAGKNALKIIRATLEKLI